MKKHLVCFGDSNTHGYSAELNGVRYDENTRWTRVLQKMLGEDYLVLEEGLCGRTTCFDDPAEEGRSAISYIYPCLKTHEPVDLLILMLGTNDTKEKFSATAERIATGLGKVIDKAVSQTDFWSDQTPNILIVTPPIIRENYRNTWLGPIMGEGCAEKSEGMAAEYEKLAKMKNCHYLDSNQLFTGVPNGGDGVHLTAQAHAQLAEGLAAKVTEIFGNKTVTTIIE